MLQCTKISSLINTAIRFVLNFQKPGMTVIFALGYKRPEIGSKVIDCGSGGLAGGRNGASSGLERTVWEGKGLKQGTMTYT